MVMKVNFLNEKRERERQPGVLSIAILHINRISHRKTIGDTLTKLKSDADVSLNGYVILQAFLDTDSFFFYAYAIVIQPSQNAASMRHEYLIWCSS